MQLGLAGAAQLIVIIRTCTEKAKTTTAHTYFATSRPADQLSPLQILHLRRGQWGIEATCHQRLDVSLHEDQSRPQPQRRSCPGPAFQNQFGPL